MADNQFNFVEPALVLYASPRMVEFIGDANRPNSPLWAQMIPQFWSFIRAYRGGFSRSTFRRSLSVLKQGGVLGIFNLKGPKILYAGSDKNDDGLIVYCAEGSP